MSQKLYIFGDSFSAGFSFESPWTNNYVNWKGYTPHGFGDSVNSNSIMRYGLENDFELKKQIQIEIESKIPYFVKNMHINLIPNLSFIDWHRDSHCIAALTVYLNEKWNDNWGGYLIYEENDELKAIKPEKNLAIIQKTPLNHSVSMVNIGADYRISLQMFLHKENEKNII